MPVMVDEKNDIPPLELSNFFNAKDLIDGILRKSNKYCKDVKMSNEKEKRSKINGKQTGLSNQGKEDVGDILRKLMKFDTATSRTKLSDLKMEKSKYSTTKPCQQETDKNISQTSVSSDLPRKMMRLSQIPTPIKTNKPSTKIDGLLNLPTKTRNNKRNLATISRPSSAKSSNSNQLVRKSPALKSKMEIFKEKIVLSADAIVETVEKSISREINATLSIGENVGTQSQLSVSPVEFPRPKKHSEMNTMTCNTRTISEEECLAKLSTLLKKVMSDKRYNAVTINQPKIRRIAPVDTWRNKKRNNSKSIAENTNKPVRKKGTMSDNSQNGSIKSQNILTGRNTTALNTCNKRALQFPNKPQRNSMLEVTKSKVNSASNKILPKNQSNREDLVSNKTKKIENDNSNFSKANDRTNHDRKKSKTRSNTTLNNNKIADIDDCDISNSASTEPSLIKKDSMNSSIRIGVRRGSSLVDNRNKSFTIPKRASSFVSPRSNEKPNSDKKASSASPLYGNSPMSDNKFRMNMVKEVQEEVKTAIENKKTFTICGDYPAVRKALRNRGWIEKYDITTTENLENEIMQINERSLSEVKNKQREKTQIDICKRLLQSRLLADHQVDFYWVDNILEVDFEKIKTTKINKFKSDLSNNNDEGLGLSGAIKNVDWFNFPGMDKIRHPRTYVLNKDQEIGKFIKDFRLTAAMSLLKWVTTNQKKSNCKIVSSNGNIPLSAFQFATNECFKKVIEASDLDERMVEASENDWNEFLECYYNIVHIGHHFESSDLETETTMTDKATYVLEKLSPLYPNIEMDGIMNIWILKPTQNVANKGIHICRTLQYIMKTAESDESVSYAVQKYIERPLLIFNTKFDIRQWFLISSTFPLTIWMYKECYLRFSNQTQNLKKLHQTIHASTRNEAKQYPNVTHNITIPNYNMWDSQQFRNYLSSIGLSDVYNEVTYKSMKECIVWAVLVQQEKMDKRKHSFELFEVDFMITEDFQPWLIEIYPNPALKSTNPVTSRLCSRVIEDTIKVVVDRGENPKAGTGSFEMIYKQSNLSSKSECDMRAFKVFGKHQPDDYFNSNWEKIQKESKRNKEERLTESKSVPNANGLTKTLESLLKLINQEKKKKNDKNLVTSGTDPIKSFDKVESKRSLDFRRCRRSSFKNLKSQLDVLTGYGDISMPEEDKKMISYALKMLKNRNNDIVIKYLIEIIENILKKTTQEKKKT